jgi:hypothetical protein
VGIEDRVLKTDLMINPHFHIAGTFCKTELQQLLVIREVRQVEFFRQFFGNIAGIDRPLFIFGEFIDTADG